MSAATYSRAVRWLCAGGLLALAAGGCSADKSATPGTTIDAGSGTGGAASGGANGSGGSVGPDPTGSGGLTGATGGTTGGGAGGSTIGSDGSIAPSPDAAAPAAGGPFACSEMVGLWVMSQWWGTFEKGVDNASWQYIFVHHGYLEGWADPASPYWATATISPCAQGATSPDRVIFLPFSLTLNTMEQWQTNISKVVDAIKMKFNGVKRIELITTVRNPGNQPCPNDNDANIVVPPYVDMAIKSVADASGGLVTVGPKIEVGACAWWGGGTDLTGAGNAGVGQLYSTYYKDHP